MPWLKARTDVSAETDRLAGRKHRGAPWHCRRAGGLLRSVSYTFERLDHWIALAREMPGQVAELYRANLNRPDIPEAGLTWSKISTGAGRRVMSLLSARAATIR